MTFASLVIVSGILCFVLDENWVHLSSGAKVPLYTLLGISVCFALVFSSIDVLNWCIGSCQSASAKGHRNSRQVYLILGVSVVMGAAFGFYLWLSRRRGCIQRLEPAPSAYKRREILLSRSGLVLGAFAAVFNERLGRNDTDYDPISQHDHFDDDDF